MKKRTRRPFYLLAIALLLITAAIVIFYESTKETEVDFSSIELAQNPGIKTDKPDLTVVSEKEDTYTLGNTISADSISQLIDLDYKAYFAMVVFQGLKPTGGYKVEIQRIARHGNTVHVYAHFTERDPANPATSVVTSPYHMVKISREGIKGEIVFIVYSDGKEILRRTDTVM